MNLTVRMPGLGYSGISRHYWNIMSNCHVVFGAVFRHVYICYVVFVIFVFFINVT